MLYRTLSSLKTSVYILSLMTFFYILGTVFPQGTGFEDYSKAGGRFLFLVKTMSLLDVFVSPLFLVLSGVLCINLLVCIYDRYTVFRRRQKILPEAMFFSSPSLIDMSAEAGMDNLLSALKAERFRAVGHESGIHVLEKGIPYWWLSWIYHLGIVFAIAGFALTAIMSFEKDVTLFKDRPVRVSLYSQDTRLNRYLKKAGINLPDRKEQKEYELLLRDFKTEYYQMLKVKYPAGKLSRLAFGLGWRGVINPLEKPALSPRMWKTSLEVKTPEGRKVDAELLVNHPFRLKGLTLYQMGFEQKVKLRVDGKDMEINSMEPFEIKGIKGSFKTSSVKTGSVFKRDGTMEAFKPFFDLSFTPEAGKKEDMGEIHMGKPVTIKGRKLLFKDIEEASVLSYRVDPGVPVIGISVLLVFVGLVLRCMGYYYRVHLGLRDGRPLMLISTRGLLADKERLIERLKGQ